MRVLQEVQSVCSRCHQPVVARYITDGQKVFIEKSCPDHGETLTQVASSLVAYGEWVSHSTVNIPPRRPLTQGADEKAEGGQCPLHCGPCTNHMQTPCCVLLEVTQRCNQHCPYCFAESRAAGNFENSDEPSLEELNRKMDYLLSLGEERPFNLQFSGGEPTIRDDLEDMLIMAKSKGFPYLQINTNGKRLALEKGYAKRLKDAGASVIFLQFDGTDDQVYQTLRNENLWEIKKKAVQACKEAVLPVTLVPTVVRGVNLHKMNELIEYMWENLDIVTGIHFQPVSFFGRYPEDLWAESEERKVTLFDVMEEIERGSMGRIKKEQLLPMNTGHPLCGFHGTFLLEEGKKVALLKDPVEISSTSVSCCCGKENPLEIIEKDRGFVLNKWGGKGQPREKECGCCDSRDALTFDDFLCDYRSRMFTLSGMAFQDMLSLDGERLKRCRVHVLAPDDRVIPFCAYNVMYRDILYK